MFPKICFVLEQFRFCVGGAYKELEFKRRAFMVVNQQCRFLGTHPTLRSNSDTGQEGCGNKKDCYILKLILIRCIHACNKTPL